MPCEVKAAKPVLEDDADIVAMIVEESRADVAPSLSKKAGRARVWVRAPRIDTRHCPMAPENDGNQSSVAVMRSAALNALAHPWPRDAAVRRSLGSAMEVASSAPLSRGSFEMKESGNVAHVTFRFRGLPQRINECSSPVAAESHLFCSV
jgi:hypothetical protein